jgi:hypothetical protein
VIPDFIIEFDRARNMADMIAQPLAKTGSENIVM